MEIHGYQLLDEIGRGDTGIVYRASNGAGQIFAFKIALDTAAFRLEQMHQEASVLQWLKHPAVPQLYDYFEHETKPCLVLELIEGQDFDTLLQMQTSPYPQAQILDWALTLAEVLEQIHQHQHIYSYLAPSHVLYSQSGKIYLVDYGKAWPYQPNATYPALGLAGYSPPEQYVGKQEPRSDIFGLGVLMYQLATIRDPRLSHAAFLFHVLPPSSLNPKLSPDFERLVLKALEHKPSERFQTMGELKAAILACAKQIP